jgi:hypothetical protein
LLTLLRNFLEHVMNRFEDYWFRISWTQPYDTWHKACPEIVDYQEPEITDFTEAQEELARIMAK